MIPEKSPTLWMIAGPNGSGKSSLYNQTDIEAFDESIWIINPDVLTERIRQIENLSQQKANLEAVIRIEAWLDASIRVHQTIGVETVLSTENIVDWSWRQRKTNSNSASFTFCSLRPILTSSESICGSGKAVTMFLNTR